MNTWLIIIMANLCDKLVNELFLNDFIKLVCEMFDALLKQWAKLILFEFHSHRFLDLTVNFFDLFSCQGDFIWGLNLFWGKLRVLS